MLCMVVLHSLESDQVWVRLGVVVDRVHMCGGIVMLGVCVESC